jgi:phosphoglucosamine mutase
MSRKYFGTDGIRGRANIFPMTADMAMKVAMAAAIAMRGAGGNSGQNRALIGKDTRLSGYMLEQAIASGFEAMGVDVIFVGPLPTPAIAMLTRSLRADIGVMISASHNPYEDNGIKLFGADGYKLSDELELSIEKLLDEDLSGHLPAPDKLGKASRLDDAQGRYIEFLKSSFPKRQNLSGLRIVVDCAHGAAYKVAPKILWELEADVVSTGISPNGKNINNGCGATHPQHLCERVVSERADIGIALDGDADRLIVVDELGHVIDGDQLLALLATRCGKRGRWRDRPWSPPSCRIWGLRNISRRRASGWSARRWATVTSSRRCARAASISAGSNPAISFFPITAPRATACSRRSRSWRSSRSRA